MYAISTSRTTWRHRMTLVQRGRAELRRRREASAWQAALAEAAEFDPRLAGELKILERTTMR